RVVSEKVPCARRPLDIGGSGPVNAQPALDGPTHPCHDGCRALSSLQMMLRDGDSRSQLVYIAVSESLALPRPRRLTDFPSGGRNEARSRRNSATPELGSRRNSAASGRTIPAEKPGITTYRTVASCVLVRARVVAAW